jgi:uncharacterized membrane protein YqgA involved in biofilm formation
MTGTIINIITVLLGSALGIGIGHRISQNARETVVRGLGLITMAIGIKMFFASANELIVLGSILVGGLLGAWWNVEEGLKRVGVWLEARFNRAEDDETDASQRFIRGFVTASLVFCVGPMTIVGSIQDGLSGDYRLLAIKSMMDGFAALAFSSSLGIGVAFSALTILVYQGGLSLLAGQVQTILTDPMVAEMTATGGVLLMGLSISALLEIKPIRVANYLPALVLAPLIVWGLTALGLPLAPQF